MKLNFTAPLNSLSFGFCTFHLLYQFWKNNIDLSFFPIGGNVDLSSYPAAPEDFQEYLKKSIHYAHDKYSREDKTLSLWHVNGSETSVGKDNNLFTFFELSSLSDTEKNILNNQAQVFVSNNYTNDIINNTTNVKSVVCPLGFDDLHFKVLNKKYYNDDRIVFGIAGKLEPVRKAHDKVIKNWVKKFGNDRRYQLHLHVSNPHLTTEQNNAILNQIFEGKLPYNVNILPYVKDLNILNDCYNAIDIIIDMSRAEGFSLPSFHCLALGKHGVIHNATAMKDWANNDNSILVNSSGQMEPFDGMFFQKGGRYNQGLIWDWNDDEFCHSLDLSIERFKKNKVNIEGLKLQKEFTWEKSFQILIENLR